MKRILKTSIAVVAVLLTVLGCASKKEAAKELQPPVLETKTILSSFYPLYIIALNVAKDVPGVIVKNMTKPQTGCLHDYQMTPDDMKTLSTASYFVVNGGGMESFLEKTVAEYPNLAVINASTGISMIAEESHAHEHKACEHDDEKKKHNCSSHKEENSTQTKIENP